VIRSVGQRSAPSAPDANRALGGRGVHDMTALRDLDFARGYHAPGRSTHGLHEGAPLALVRRDSARNIGRADRGRRGTRAEQRADAILKSEIVGSHLASAARIAAVGHAVPVAFPLLAPFDATPTRRAGFLNRGHTSSLTPGRALALAERGAYSRREWSPMPCQERLWYTNGDRGPSDVWASSACTAMTVEPPASMRLMIRPRSQVCEKGR